MRLRNVQKTWRVFVPRYFKLGPHSAKSFLTCGPFHRFEDRQHRSQVRGISGELSFPCLPLDRQRASIEDYLIYFDPFCLTIFFPPNIHGTSDEISSKVEKTFDRFLQDKPQEWRAAEAESMPNSSNSKAIFPTHEKNPVQLRERCLLKLDFCHCFLAIIGKNLDCQQSCLTELGISVGCAGVGRLPWRRHVLPRDYEKNQGGMSFLWFFCDPNDPNDPNGFFKMFFCAVRWIWALQSLPCSASKKR